MMTGRDAWRKKKISNLGTMQANDDDVLTTAIVLKSIYHFYFYRCLKILEVRK